MYQLIGGSCDATIGMSSFDPCLIKGSGAREDIIWVNGFYFNAVVLHLESDGENIKSCFIVHARCWGKSITTVSLQFMQVRVFDMNDMYVAQKYQADYIWAYLVRYTYFHWLYSTMLTKKRNMVLGYVGVLIFVYRKDVEYPIMCMDECNYHAYGGWRTEKQGFNMKQLIILEEKHCNQLREIMEGKLKISWSKWEFKGYQETFGEYIENVKNPGKYNYNGLVDVDINEPAV